MIVNVKQYSEAGVLPLLFGLIPKLVGFCRRKNPINFFLQFIKD